MNNKKARKQLDQEFNRTAMIDLANTTRWVIRSAAGILLLFFGWLKFRGVEWASVARDVPADLIFKGAMSLYFLCWVAGTLSDTHDQEQVYIHAPNKGSIPVWGWAATALLTFVFGIMCWVDTYEKFVLVLSVFLVINIVFWRYLIKSFLSKTVRGLEKKYNETEHYFELEQLRLVFRAYLSGSWQWARFVIGFVMIIFLMAAAYTTLGSTMGVLLGGLSRDLVLSLATLLFVLVMEAWIWLYRFRVKMGLKLLNGIKKDYKLVVVKHNPR